MRLVPALKWRLQQESGAALVLAAIALLFIFGIVALALDGGRGMDERRSVQNAADHAAIAAAWAKCNGADPVAAGEAFAAANGYSPGELTLNPNYGPYSVEAVVNTSIEGKVSPVLGVDQIGVRNRAVATCQFIAAAGGDLPFGAPGGGVFDGDMQINNPCDTGNCRPLVVPRWDIRGTGNTLIRNIAWGIQPTLIQHWDDASGYPVCRPGDTECHVLDTDTGVSTAHLSNGMIRGSNVIMVDGRLENIGPAMDSVVPYGGTAHPYGRVFDSPQGRQLDGDYYWYILEGASSPSATIRGLDDIRKAVCDGTIPEPTVWPGRSGAPCTPPLGQQTWISEWIDPIHGDFWTVSDHPQRRHLYYDGEVEKCDSSRLAQTPVVTDDLSFDPLADPFTPPPLDPNGKKPVKYLGSYHVIIDSPIAASDLNNSDSIKTTSAWIIWYGPNAWCENGWPTGENVPAHYIVTLDE